MVAVATFGANRSSWDVVGPFCKQGGSLTFLVLADCALGYATLTDAGGLVTCAACQDEGTAEAGSATCTCPSSSSGPTCAGADPACSYNTWAGL
jgi:hypothetical protein